MPENSENKTQELPMLDLFRKYCKQVEANDRNGKVISAAILASTDAILRYVDFIVKMSFQPQPPKEESSVPFKNDFTVITKEE